MGVVTDGNMLYGGWFYFVGRNIAPPPTLEHAGKPPERGEVEYRITEIGPGAREAFAGYPTIAIDFLLYTPWLLAEGAY